MKQEAIFEKGRKDNFRADCSEQTQEMRIVEPFVIPETVN